MSPWLLLALLATAPPPSVHLDAPPALRPQVEAALLHERPDTRLTATASTADLAFALVEREGALELSLRAGERLLETRALGAEREAAIRLAVLLIGGHVDDRGREVAPSPLEGSPPAAPTDPPPSAAPPAAPAGASPSSRRAAWFADATFQAAVRSQARLGASAGVLRRLDPWVVGGRVVASGLCCTLHGDGIEVDALQVALLLEGRRVLWSGPVELSAALAVGMGVELLAVRALVFAGPAGLERSVDTGLVARGSLVVQLPLRGGSAATAAVGVEVQSSDWSARLPAPYDAGREPLDRPPVLPFVELGLVVDLF